MKSYPRNTNERMSTMSEHGWISLDDRKPTPDQVVLLWDVLRLAADIGFVSIRGTASRIAIAKRPKDRIKISYSHWRPLYDTGPDVGPCLCAWCGQRIEKADEVQEVHKTCIDDI